MMVTIRFFAAAREAAGRPSVEVAAGPIGGQLAGLGLGARFDEVLAVSTVLCDGRRIELDDPVGAGATVDVLPPFAGG
ncbi:MAG: MoaD/ThiS family protein [Candidatus Nanopelagicales bacterium]|nr:MoaD/ThiS family protein [Candidatus Nanopelagicales bacterium]HRV67316.1 MoaD/ThiS family protein [Candidatus Nanopelagicales bacterium]